MRHSPSCRILSVIVSFAIVAVSLPLYAFAADISDNTPFVAGDAGSASSNAKIIEVNESRTTTEKTFRLTDGSFYTAHYDTDIHEEDENGRFTDIDNRLYRQGDSISTSNGRYSFPYKTSVDSSLFTLSGKENSISFSLAGAAKGIKGEITNTETEFGKDTDPLEVLTTLDNIRSSVISYGVTSPALAYSFQRYVEAFS